MVPSHRRARAASPHPPSLAVIAAVVAGALVAGGCSTIPKDRYGIEELTFEGNEDVDERSLASCLVTRQRDAFAINIGRSWDPSCGEPPFDGNRARLSMWSWPWTEWPLYDRALFDRDLERIERWYKARGYYDARVLDVRFDPPSAAETDRIEGEGEEASCLRKDDDEGCGLAIAITVEEGEPVRVTEANLTGAEKLPRDLRASLRNAMRLEVGDRWDESFYDETKRELARRLREGSYACARVEGRVNIRPEEREAEVSFDVYPGPRARIGEIRIEGNEDLPVEPIRGAALLETGDIYSETGLDDAQRAIYNLGAFSAVRVEPIVSAEHCPAVGPQPDDDDAPDGERPQWDPVRIPVSITVTPGRRVRWGIGGGVQSGTIRTTAGDVDVRQWDVHLLAMFEHRNFLGGLRRLRIEERPRLIFQNIFPRATDPTPGNLALIEFRQPAFLEPRTTLVTTARYDLGPEPFGGRFNRHDIDARIALERGFLDGRVFLSGGIHGNLFIVRSQQIPTEEEGTRDYHLMFFEQYANLDLRDDPRRPSRGAFFSLRLHEAGYGLPASWDYVRVAPEARGYVPLPLDIVLAVRFGIAAIFITDADQGLIQSAQKLGPEQYRLRGGGPSSNRGFIPGDLGAGIEGGRRRWEANVELRVPLTESFGLVAFTDFGDVTFSKSYRFDHWHPSVGGGLRYKTPVGPLRLDVGYRLPGVQVLGGPDPPSRFEADLGFATFPGAIHLTIGESF
ncbi:MAG: BamA/OMP85 family outer membrane protein [Myxococcota bacterium]